MTPVSIAILSMSMSADAFAAAMCRGAYQKPRFVTALKAGLVFGVIEAITPLLGWSIGMLASSFVSGIDHWIAFCLLGIIGAKMLIEGIWREEEIEHGGEICPPENRRGGIVSLVLTAIGTSIDAAAVGVSLAILGVNILLIAACIGLATFTMATIGLLLGRVVGARFGPIAEIIGGFALMALGVVIVLEHLGYLS